MRDIRNKNKQEQRKIWPTHLKFFVAPECQYRESINDILLESRFLGFFSPDGRPGGLDPREGLVLGTVPMVSLRLHALSSLTPPVSFEAMFHFFFHSFSTHFKWFPHIHTSITDTSPTFQARNTTPTRNIQGTIRGITWNIFHCKWRYTPHLVKKYTRLKWPPDRYGRTLFQRRTKALHTKHNTRPAMDAHTHFNIQILIYSVFLFYTKQVSDNR